MAEREATRRAVQVVRLGVGNILTQGRQAHRRRHQPTIQGKSEVRLDVSLNTCEGVWGGRAVRKWQRGRWEGRGEESASNDDSIKPSQSGLREDA